VLIVEDEAPLRNLLQRVLRLHGYTAVTAATVQEAEKLFQQLGAGAIALVIADINLSNNPAGQEGYELFQRWTAAHPTLPFVLISGATSSRTLPAVRTGAVRFLAKPFPLDELLETVRALVE
jgi:DNA-binding NtrC family response regulator